LEKQCKKCNIKFEAKRKDKQYCSITCKNAQLGSEWRANNVDIIKLNNEKYRNDNSSKVKLDNKNWRNNNAEKIKEAKKKWQEEFKIKHGCSYSTFKRNNDLNERIKHNIRVRINKAINGINKSGSAVKELGCSIEEFKIYIESKFEPWMTWDNYGKYDKNIQTWNIDHIKPLDSFDLSNEEEFKRACYYKNLRPFSSKENLMKGSKNPFTV